MSDWVASLKAYDWGGDRGSLAAIDQSIVNANGNKKALKTIELGLLDVLRSEVSVPAKEYACRQLAIIGTGRSVRTLARMLHHAELADCARFALEAIPDRIADRVLRKALNEADGVRRVGIVNTLGERGDPKSIQSLAMLQSMADPELTDAVEAALRRIESSTYYERWRAGST